MKGLRLYLAHPTGSREIVRLWEKEFERDSGIELINPFYDISNEGREMDDGLRGPYDIDPEMIVLRDTGAIATSNGMVTWITHELSYGTIQEMVYAKMLGKENYSLILNGHHKHPWLRYHSTKIFTELGDLEKHLHSLV